MHSLIKEKVESWEMKDCPWCMDNKEDKIPLTDPKTGEIIETISVVDSVDNESSLKKDIVDHPNDIAQEEENTITEEKIVL